MTVAVHHPGEILAHELDALGVTPTELARLLHVPAIVNRKRGITGDSALRLAHWFGNGSKFWMTLQARYDLQLAKKESGDQIEGLPTRLRHTAPHAKRQAKSAHGKAA